MVSTFPYPSRSTFQWLYETEGENSTVPAGTERYIFSSGAASVVRAASARAGAGRLVSARAHTVASADSNRRIFMASLLLVLVRFSLGGCGAPTARHPFAMNATSEPALWPNSCGQKPEEAPTHRRSGEYRCRIQRSATKMMCSR